MSGEKERAIVSLIFVAHMKTSDGTQEERAALRNLRESLDGVMHAAHVGCFPAYASLQVLLGKHHRVQSITGLNTRGENGGCCETSNPLTKHFGFSKDAWSDYSPFSVDNETAHRIGHQYLTALRHWIDTLKVRHAVIVMGELPLLLTIGALTNVAPHERLRPGQSIIIEGTLDDRRKTVVFPDQVTLRQV